MSIFDRKKLQNEGKFDLENFSIELFIKNPFGGTISQSHLIHSFYI